MHMFLHDHILANNRIRWHFCLYLMGTFLLCSLQSSAQPVLSSEQQIDGIRIFEDFKTQGSYYYAPGELNLALENNGQPRFQLLEMRYTGSSAYGDRQKKQFLNMVQLTISMEGISSARLNRLKSKIGSSGASLRPLPIRNIEAFLVTPFGGNDAGYKRIGKSGSFQSENNSGKTTKSGFWTERTFTLKLENHEAQLLWEQIETGKLALSFGYAFYADVIPGQTKGDYNISGNYDSTFVKNLDEAMSEALQPDTNLVTQIIQSNAFPISIDVKQWPELLKKVDINEEVPPAYAALEVKCYDFADNLRPDMALKSIEIQATGVGGRMIKLPAKRFSRSQPDLHTLQIRFPYAVKMNKPLRYKVTEYSLEGSKSESEWVTKDNWTEIIDITTDIDNNKLAKKTLEIECDPTDWEAVGIQKVAFVVKFHLDGKLQKRAISIAKEDPLPIKFLTFIYDTRDPIIGQSIWTMDDGSVEKSEADILPDDYLFLSLQKK
jgi:hypothetical protein